MSTSKIQRSEFVLACALILASAFARLIPHPPNVTPLVAVGLFAGFAFSNRAGRFGALIPLATMFLSDIVLGFHPLQPLIYALLLIPYYIGSALPQERYGFKLAGASLASSTLFFAGSNLGEWALGWLYPRTLEGLWACFIAAIPFFRNQLVGDLVFTGALFAVFELSRRYGLRSARAMN